MSYYPTEEEEFEMLCDDELEIEREMELGMYCNQNTLKWQREVIITFDGVYLRM